MEARDSDSESLILIGVKPPQLRNDSTSSLLLLKADERRPTALPPFLVYRRLFGGDVRLQDMYLTCPASDLLVLTMLFNCPVECFHLLALHVNDAENPTLQGTLLGQVHLVLVLVLVGILLRHMGEGE